MTNPGGNVTSQLGGERKGVIIHMWLISLAISVLCCALFLMMTSFYVKDLNDNLEMINNRLANIETRTMVVAPGSMPTTEIAPAPIVAPAPTTEGAATPPVNVDVPTLPSTPEPSAAAPLPTEGTTTTTTTTEPAPATPAAK